MKKIIYLSIFLIGLTQTSCKTKQPTNTSSTGKTERSVFNKTLTVEFYSKGSGINHSAFGIMESLLNKTTDGVSCEFENRLVRYGREGERQYCMTFNDEKCYSAMIAVIKQKMDNQENVRVTENGTCHKHTR